MKQLENLLAGIFAKLPKLPASVRQLLVQIAPYLALAGAVLFVTDLIGLSDPITLYGGSWSYHNGGALGIMFGLATAVLYGLAVPGLFKRSLEGWRYMFWAALVGGLQGLVMNSTLGFLISLGISLYLAFQVREHYH